MIFTQFSWTVFFFTPDLQDVEVFNCPQPLVADGRQQSLAFLMPPTIVSATYSVVQNYEMSPGHLLLSRHALHYWTLEGLRSGEGLSSRKRWKLRLFGAGQDHVARYLFSLYFVWIHFLKIKVFGKCIWILHLGHRTVCYSDPMTMMIPTLSYFLPFAMEILLYHVTQ